MLPSFHKQMEKAGNRSWADRTDLLWVRANLLRRDVYGIIRSPPTICAGHRNCSLLHLWRHVMNGQEEKPGVTPRRSSAPPVFHPPLPVWLAASPQWRVRARLLLQKFAVGLPGTCEDPEMGNLISTSSFRKRHPFWELQSAASVQAWVFLPTRSGGQPRSPPPPRHGMLPAHRHGQAKPALVLAQPVLTPHHLSRSTLAAGLPWQTERAFIASAHVGRAIFN